MFLFGGDRCTCSEYWVGCVPCIPHEIHAHVHTCGPLKTKQTKRREKKMNEQSSLHAHHCFPGDVIQAQRSWLGMKNQSDILLALEVGQTEGHTHSDTHARTHYSFTTLYASVMEKRAKSFMSFPSRNRNWYSALCAFISLYLSLSQWNIHTHISDCHQVRGKKIFHISQTLQG